MKTLFVSFFTFFSTVVFCQVPKPVKWSFVMEKKSDLNSQFRAVATIEKGWNIYSVYMGDEGPIPTSFTFDKIEGGSLEGKILELSKSQKSLDPLFDMEVIKFKEEAIFAQTLKGGKGMRLQGSVMYMCCDSNRCLPPTTEVFNLSL